MVFSGSWNSPARHRLCHVENGDRKGADTSGKHTEHARIGQLPLPQNSAVLTAATTCWQMEEEGVPSTALREVSVLQMLNESTHVVRCAAVRTPG